MDSLYQLPEDNTETGEYCRCAMETADAAINRRKIKPCRIPLGILSKLAFTKHKYEGYKGRGDHKSYKFALSVIIFSGFGYNILVLTLVIY